MPNKEGKGGIETAPNGTVPSTGRRRWQVGTEFAGGRTIRMEDPDPLADRICRSALSLFASLLLSIEGYILHLISEPAARRNVDENCEIRSSEAHDTIINQ